MTNEEIVEEARIVREMSERKIMTPRQRAGAVIDMFTLDLMAPGNNRPPVTVERIILAIEQAINVAVEEERAACTSIAEAIRKRELANYNGSNCPYHTIAEEIRDRIQMRPATGNDDWPELGSADDQWAIRNLSRS